MDEQRQSHAALAQRVREVRRDLYGDSGGPILAEEWDLPMGTRANYESGVVIPAPVILHFVEISGADPYWLLTGLGQRHGESRATRAGSPAVRLPQAVAP
jgi:hypothetical protein